jgi:hypothetical protein
LIIVRYKNIICIDRGEILNNNLRQTLYEVVEGLLHWEQNLTNVNVREINKVMYSFCSLLISRGAEEFPLNLPEFISTLQHNTLENLGFNEGEATKTLLAEKIIVNERINKKFKNWYEDLVSLAEEEQKAMLEFLQLCRGHRGKDDEEEYCNFYRNGRSLVNKSNMIMSNIEFQSILQRKFPADIRKAISRWRKNINISARDITICPVCGKQIEFTFGNENSCSDICNYFIRKQGLAFETLAIDDSNQYSEFTQGIYRYILLPNIGEKLIYEKLLDIKEIEVELYPNMDEYDIKVKFEELDILIDVKDVESPLGLVELLRKNNTVNKLLQSKTARRYLIIPEHRRVIHLSQNNVDYKRELLNILDNEGLDINVLYEKELYKEIEKIVQEDF